MTTPGRLLTRCVISWGRRTSCSGLHTDTRSGKLSGPAASGRPDWNRAVSEAEKIVGYPTSFLSLRWLLSDEIANVALHLRKLVGSNHPLLKTANFILKNRTKNPVPFAKPSSACPSPPSEKIAKSLLYGGKNNMQAWGLIVLLISKAAGHINVQDMEEDKAAGVLYSQRALAEVIEMIRTSHLVHKGLVNIYTDQYSEPAELNDVVFGNKIALLSGDYLLGNSCVELAMLRNQDLIELISTAVRDLSESEFLGRRDKQNNALPDYGANALADWTYRNVLSAGSLLGKSCQGTLQLGGHARQIQEKGYKFGKHLALAWQACLDLEPFIGSNHIEGSMFNLTSAPVMFHLERDPSLMVEIDKGLESVESVDYEKIRGIVSKGPGIELTKRLQRDHSNEALEVLKVFQESDARTALSNIIFAMGEI